MSNLVPVEGVEIFCAGMHRNSPYTKADLDQMAANFKRLQGVLDPPLVVGHGESDTWLKDTGYPAAGWVSNVRNEYGPNNCLECSGTGRKLGKMCPFCGGKGKAYVQLADFKDVPNTFAQLIKGRAYAKVSSEVYDDFTHGPTHYGKSLRRVAALGGELPQIKSLADLPVKDYSERAPRRATLRPGKLSRRDGDGYFVAFSEVSPMAVKTRVKRGSLSAKAKAVWKKFADEPTPELAAAPPPETTGDDVKAMLIEMGFDPAVLEGADETLLAEIARVFKTMESTAAMSDAPAVTTPAVTTPGLGSGNPSQVIVKYSEDGKLDVTALAADIRASVLAELAGVRKDVSDTVANHRKASIQSFCESMVAAGKMLPVELTTRDGQLGAVDFAHSLDNVQKFAETGRTQLDLWMESIRNRPQLVKMSESVRGNSGSGSSKDSDVKEVESHFETFSETFIKHGVTKEALVKGYTETKKLDPTLTPDKYLNVR